MTEGEYLRFSINEEITPYFDASSIPSDGSPKLVLVLGAVAVGKTQLIRQRYATGYVLVDSVPIFLSLCQGQNLDFPGPLEAVMEVIGRLVAERAVVERRNIVTEFVPESGDEIKELMDAMLALGYRGDIVYVECPFEEAGKRNLNRDEDCISSFFAGKYQRRWLLEAARKVLAPEEPR